MSRLRRLPALVVLAAIGTIAACHPRGADGPAVTLLGEAEPITATAVGVAPMFAVSPDLTRAVAWVSAPDSGTEARLYVSVGNRPPAELRDPLGPIEAHGESPPKLAYGPDGTLNAIYVVPKLVPGRRFPLAALRFTRSTDRGATWTAPATVTDDAEFGTHNFHALHAAADGSLYLAWLDSRDGASAAYITRSTDGGETWEANRPVATGEACPCCRTALATSAGGAVYVAWRMVFPGSVRDIVVARSDDHGATWRAPVRVHADDWVYPGCPHAGPSIQVDSADRLHVAWWTGKEGRAGVAYARSDDGGASFGPPVALGLAQYSRPAHVQMALGPAGTVAVAWDDGTVETPRIVLRVSADGGETFGPALPLSDPGRAASFPVLAIAGREVTVAWSEENAASAKAAAEAAAARPKNAPMGLQAVGEARVMVRRATLAADGGS